MVKQRLLSGHRPSGERVCSGDGFVQVGAQLWSSPGLTLGSVTHLRAAFVASLELPRASLLPGTWLLRGSAGRPPPQPPVPYVSPRVAFTPAASVSITSHAGVIGPLPPATALAGDPGPRKPTARSSVGSGCRRGSCSPQTLPSAPRQLSLTAQPAIPSLFLVQFCLKVAYGLLLRKAYVCVKPDAPPGTVPTRILQTSRTPFFAAHSDAAAQGVGDTEPYHQQKKERKRKSSINYSPSNTLFTSYPLDKKENMSTPCKGTRGGVFCPWQLSLGCHKPVLGAGSCGHGHTNVQEPGVAPKHWLTRKKIYGDFSHLGDFAHQMHLGQFREQPLTAVSSAAASCPGWPPWTPRPAGRWG